MALQTGVLVAFTQAIPEHQIQVFGIFKARVKVKCDYLGRKWLLMTLNSRSQWRTTPSQSSCLLLAINLHIYSFNSDGWSLTSG